MQLDSPPLPARRAYLEKQKAAGRRVLGVFPAQYPREVLWALNALPVEIWDPPLAESAAGAHLQPYICSVVRLGLELILSGGADQVDGYLFPHTCDSVQNLASVVNDYLGQDKPCYFFYHPKAPYGAPAKDFYLAKLKALARDLAPLLDPLDQAALAEAVQLGRRQAAALAGLYAARAQGELGASNAEFYRLVRAAEYLHPDDFIPLAEGFLAERRGRAKTGTPVILSGVLPNPPDLLRLLDDLGVRVAADDLIMGGRRWLAGPSEAADPWQALAEGYFALPPCSTKGSPIAERLDFLRDLVTETGARAVIFQMVKFCEPELFDAPMLVEGLKKDGLATLVMDTEVNQALSGQMATRVEAMLEMLE